MSSKFASLASQDSVVLPHGSPPAHGKVRLADLKAEAKRRSASARAQSFEQGGSVYAFIPPHLNIRVCRWPQL